MKKKLTSLLCLCLLLALLPVLPACDSGKDDGRISIVCTLFPQYDWLRSIIGDSESIDVSLLIKNGTDPHSYQPTAADILTISNCDMIVYVGSDSDVWVKEALERANDPSIKQIALSQLEGMTLHNVSSHSHYHEDHGHDHKHDHDHGVFDEHLWLSLNNAITATKHLTEAVCALDPTRSELYRSNADGYAKALSALNGEYRSAVESADPEDRFVLFADRFPFVYLLSDCGVEYSAAFEGCTTDVDASFDTVLGLIKEANTHGVKYIAVTETSDKALASTVASSAKNDIEILVMDSLQSVSKKQLSEGISYLSVMEKNLTALKTALGVKGE